MRKVIQAAKKLFARPKPQLTQLRSYHDHGIPEEALNLHAVTIIKTLFDAGFAAYIVGGGIRDLLCGLHPKDFDVATNATPEQVRSLFRNSRIIGRRFRLVHVFYGREIIEVATFRTSDENHQELHSNAQGLLLRDNIFGNIDDDALRRDFTVNALYYDINKHELLDYVGGYTDIQNKILRLMGDPITRYREDPVRLLRAIRFAAKLNFALEKNTAKPISSLAHLLEHVSHARLFDEMRKLFLTGHSEQTLKLLCEYKLFGALFAQTAAQLKNSKMNCYAELFLIQTCRDTDLRLAQAKKVTSAFFIAAFLWPCYQERLTEVTEGKLPHLQQLEQVAREILKIQHTQTAIPVRFSGFILEIWAMQIRLTHLKIRNAKTYLELRSFRASYDFLALRAKVAKQYATKAPAAEVAAVQQEAQLLADITAWWETFQSSDEVTQDELLKQFPGKRKAQRRRRKRSRHSSSHSNQSTS